ncbi:carbon-nitrogen hydrolase family protein [Nioella nitratireducens]|uniref:carbon-nitrogen hydrolase family protein n=1 Tax=Nioella nitratireducens TaxID=1287720 RepID=UPI0008FD196C|nr:carbon-nitrogen hydrolase family protein [Nioella nitratireducens]
MKAGVWQSDGADLTPKARLAALEAAIAGQGLDVVLCPELFAAGYHIGDALEAAAERAAGPFAQAVQALAKRTGTAVLYGYAERDGAQVFNSAQLIGPDGPVAHHRKLVIPPGPETGRFAQGKGCEVFEFCGLRCAILICYDAEFPEGPRAAALAGADVLFVPTALSDQWGNVSTQVMPARAFENGLWLLYANHAGEEAGLRYFGGSRIVGPVGQSVAEAGTAPDLIMADLDAASVRAARKRLPYLADRAGLLRRLGAGR